jgi:hypothetical protein
MQQKHRIGDVSGSIALRLTNSNVVDLELRKRLSATKMEIAQDEIRWFGLNLLR